MFKVIAPSEKNSEKIVTHRFFYDVPGKRTIMLETDDVPTEYYWNEDLKLINPKTRKKKI